MSEVVADASPLIALRGGADVRHVQEILGHQDLKTTALYTRMDVGDLRAVIERCHPRERAQGGTWDSKIRREVRP